MGIISCVRACRPQSGLAPAHDGNVPDRVLHRIPDAGDRLLEQGVRLLSVSYTHLTLPTTERV